MNIGIDRINFFVPPYYVDMSELAIARDIDPNKFLIGIGQSEMSIAPKTQDIVTFATNAAKSMLSDNNLSSIDMIIVGTESGIDESKASAVVLHRLLGIQPFARAFDIKEACYGATAGLQYAISHINRNPESQVLVIASDNARYGLNTGGEPTQGAGSVAMLIKKDPSILTFNNDNVSLTQDIYDFWRPVGHEYPLVDGPLSNETYINSFQKVWNEYKKRTDKDFSDFHALTFHVPYTKMGKKALLSELESADQESHERLLARYEESIVYSRRIGNLYTGSLYLGLLSLLENSSELDDNNLIGLFSYGSGAVAEFFTGHLVPGYKSHLDQEAHLTLLNTRQKLTITEYERMFEDKLDSSTELSFTDTIPFSITSISNTIRHYKE